MISIPFLPIGLILLLVGAPDHWFAGAATIGWICIGVSLIGPVVLLLVFLAGLVGVLLSR